MCSLGYHSAVIKQYYLVGVHYGVNTLRNDDESFARIFPCYTLAYRGVCRIIESA